MSDGGESSGGGGGGGVNIPGVGRVHKSWLMYGGIAFFAVIGYAYYKNHKAGAAASAGVAATSAADQYANTGAADSGTGYAGYGGIDPSTGQPYAYENYLDYGKSSSASSITTNEEWVTEAIQDGQGYGATYTVAQSAVEKYMAQSPSGLPSDEYVLMQSVVAELGQPPSGGPYRLIQASSGTGGGNPPGGGNPTKSIADSVGKVAIVPVNVVPPNTVQKVATRYGLALGHLLQYNPGKTSASTGEIQVPFQISAGMTLHSIAQSFGDSDEHMAIILSSQGIV